MAVVELNKDIFQDVVTKNDMVIVDFWAPWCGQASGLGAAGRPSAGTAPRRSERNFVWSLQDGHR